MIDTIPDTQPTTDRQRREALYHAFEEHVDPKTYNGGDCCLVKQTAKSLAASPHTLPIEHHGLWYPYVHYLAEFFGVDEELVRGVYFGVCHDEYVHDYAAAMQMAKERLGLT